jgi:N-acetylneuraminic acid mutarotase
MRRIWVVCAALVLLAGFGAGCGHQPTPDQGEIKQASIRQLIAFCADVDRQLANVSMERQPGTYADQFGRFVNQARSQPAPDVDRTQFETLLTEMDGSARHFRAAHTALAAGDQPAYQKALAQAQRQFGSADAAAQKYGMPPLKTCPQHESTTPPPASPSTPAPAEAWQPRHASLAAVQQVSAAVLDGKIWVAGGLTKSKATASTQFYDPTRDAWQPGQSLPEAVDHAMLVRYQNQLVLIGGYRSRGGELVASAEVWSFDDSTGHWVPGKPLNHARAAGAAAVVGDKIVVVGGRTGTGTGTGQLVGQTEVYDGKAWRDGADIPVPGDHLTAASDRDYLYAVGGRKFKSSNNTNAVQRYDPATDRWTPLAPLPKPLSGAGAAVINGQLLVAGGENTTPTVVSTVQAYDLIAPTPTWITLPSLTEARHGLAVAAIDNTLYAIGGSTQPGHTASTNTVDALTFS